MLTFHVYLVFLENTREDFAEVKYRVHRIKYEFDRITRDFVYLRGANLQGRYEAEPAGTGVDSAIIDMMKRSTDAV